MAKDLIITVGGIELVITYKQWLEWNKDRPLYSGLTKKYLKEVLEVMSLENTKNG